MNATPARSFGAATLFLLLAHVSVAPVLECSVSHDASHGGEATVMVHAVGYGHDGGADTDSHGTGTHADHPDGHEGRVPPCGALATCGAAALPLATTAQPSISGRLTLPFGGFVANPSSRVPSLHTPPPKA